SRLRIEIAGAAMMIYLQKRVIDQNGRSPSSFEKAKIRCGMTDLSQDEAISISKLGMFTTAKILFKSDTLNSNDIDFEFLLQMEDLGIISGVQGGNVSSLEVTMKSNYADKFSNQIINKNRILLIHSDDPKKEVKLPIYKVTKLGEDILSLGDFKANDDFMRDIGHKIKQQGFEVTLATWLQTTTEYGNYFNPELI
ncbi:hypothetical protein ACEUD2_19855, partial [Aeromonas veronii]